MVRNQQFQFYHAHGAAARTKAEILPLRNGQNTQGPSALFLSPRGKRETCRISFARAKETRRKENTLKRGTPRCVPLLMISPRAQRTSAFQPAWRGGLVPTPKPQHRRSPPLPTKWRQRSSQTGTAPCSHPRRRRAMAQRSRQYGEGIAQGEGHALVSLPFAALFFCHFFSCNRKEMARLPFARAKEMRK